MVNKKTTKKNTNSQQGQAFVLAVIVLAVVLVNALVIISNSLSIFRNSNYRIQDVQATNLAEAGIDKAVASLNANPAYNGENNTPLGDGQYSVVVSNVSTSKIGRAHV